MHMDKDDHPVYLLGVYSDMIRRGLIVLKEGNMSGLGLSRFGLSVRFGRCSYGR